MKRITAVLLCLLLLTGCTPQPDRGISVRLDIGVEQLRGIYYEYAAGAGTLGSAEITNADGSGMERGAVVWLQFLPEDFPEGEIPEVFTVRVFLVDRRGQKVSTEDLIIVRRDARDSLCFRLEGSEPEGYRIRTAD